MESFIKENRFVPVDFDPFSGPAIERTVPTTEAQREVIIASRMGDEASCAYNESVSLELSGPLDRDALDRAMAALVERHEALRSVISANGSRMIVHAPSPFQMPFTDLAAQSPEKRATALEAIASADMTTPFPLLSGPNFRAHLVRTGEQQHLLRLSGHHALVDGWSLGIIMADVGRLYNGFASGEAPRTPAVHSFTDYVLAVGEFEESPDHDQVERYWLDLYQGTLPRVDLPTDRPRPAVKTYRAHRIDIPLSTERTKQVKELATRSGASFVTTLLTLYEVLIYRLTGDPDVIVGLPAAGQSDLGMKELVGHCVNLLALRSRVDEERSFIEHLKARRTGVLDAFDNQKYTFGTLVRKLNVPREPGRIPLAPVVFNIDMNMDDGVRFDGLAHRFISNPRAFENFELFLNASGNDKHLTLEWSYNTDLFDASTIRDWMKELETLIARTHADPHLDIATLTSPEAPTQQGEPPQEAWLGRSAPYPQVSIGRLFKETARAFPGNVALEHNDTRLTYADLDVRSDALARVLIARGIRPGDHVGLCFDRCVASQITMLAIIKAGACYVPIDLSYPEERVRYMVDDAEVTLLVTLSAIAPQLPIPTDRILLVDTEGRPEGELPEAASRIDLREGDLAGPDSAAHIIYTSGSTGLPKGVVIPHRGVVRLVRAQNYMDYGPGLTFLQVNNICFDAATFEQWGALLNGARLVLQPQAKPTMREIATAIKQYKVDTCLLTAGMFNMMVDEHPEALRGMKNLCTGGDAMSPPHARKAVRELGPNVVVNLYGPTENTVLVTGLRLMREDEIGQTVPIGKPVTNSRAYVLDARRRPVPVGAKGELYCAGDGLATEYWNRPELTDERFVPDPFVAVPGARMYRTGDLVRWLPDGNIEFLGRADDQVKIRGMRVELGEIEATMDSEGSLKDRVVVVRGSTATDKQVVAYIIPDRAEKLALKDDAAQEQLIERLRNFMGKKLPEHMVPTAWVLMESFPLNPSGKVDRKALPPPDAAKPVMRTDHVAPRDATERVLAGIWNNVLGTTDIGVHDNFFDLGGHSMAGLQLLEQVEQRFGKALPFKELFTMPTIAQMAQHLGQVVEDDSTLLVAIRPAGAGVPLFCIHGDETNHFIPKYLGKERPFYGIVHQGEDGGAIRWNTVEGMAAKYLREIRAVRPHGPYYLCGYSFGGIVAFEMARQLNAAGEQTPVLVLFDTYAPGQHLKAMARDRKFYDPVKRFAMRNMVKRALDNGRPVPAKLRTFHIIDTYNKAVELYRPEPYTGRITLIKAGEAWGPRTMGWDELAHGGVDVRTMNGDHYSMIKEPNVQQLVAHLADAVATADRQQATGTR